MIVEDKSIEDIATVAGPEAGIALIEIAPSQALPKESSARAAAHPRAFVSRERFIWVPMNSESVRHPNNPRRP